MADTRLHRDISAAEGPIYRRLMEALKNCQSARQISQCIDASGHLIDTERDAVMQRHGYPPRLWPSPLPQPPESEK